jgi:hypothetical protein
MRPVAAARAPLASAAAAVALAAVVALVAGRVTAALPPPLLHVILDRTFGIAELACTAVVSALFAGGLVRTGPRGWLKLARA